MCFSLNNITRTTYFTGINVCQIETFYTGLSLSKARLMCYEKLVHLSQTMKRLQLACENIRFSSLFAAGDVSNVPERPQLRRARRNGCFRRLDYNLFVYMSQSQQLSVGLLYFVNKLLKIAQLQIVCSGYLLSKAESGS